ncbi:hypothetical protein LSPH24S_01120 [Lysinibacillus sphaericus]
MSKIPISLKLMIGIGIIIMLTSLYFLQDSSVLSMDKMDR